MNAILKLCFAIVIASSFHLSSQAQKQNSSDDNHVKKSSFQLFFEKVYLHLDRSLYASGEDIWFKAYLLNGQSNYLTNTSNNLYVELIAPTGEITDRKVVRLQYGTGFGDFKLSDSISQGKYRIRAYTNWMRNFRDCFIFEKEIEISSNLGINSKILPQIFDSTKYDIQFFPEGGSMVCEIGNTVGFKATDQMGRGLDIRGIIVSSQGDTVASFASTNRGMGKFNFFPMSGMKYRAVGKVKDQIPFQVNLPDALPTGFVLRLINNNSENLLASVMVNQETFEKYKDKEIYVIGRAYGKNCFSAPVVLKDKQLNFRIPKSSFPGGIASITLYDSEKHPQAERIVFIEPKEKINVTVITDKNIYKGREKVDLTIKTTDQKGSPVKADLSVSLVDGSLVTEEPSDIRSYLLLNSEIRGKIENPSAYFDTLNRKRQDQLDLLLMTQGWRNYLWKQVMDSVIRLKYMVEPGITISGRVRQKFADRPIPKSNVTLFLPGAKKGVLMATTTDSLGNYFFDGLEFYGDKKVILTTANSKGKNTGWILKNPTYGNPLEAQVLTSCKIPEPVVDKFAEEASNKKKTMKKFSLSDGIELKEVVVKGRSKQEQDQENSHFSEGGYADFNFKIKDDDLNYTDIGMFLINKVPGATLAETDPQNPVNNTVVFHVSGEDVQPRFVLDKFPISSDDVDLIYNLSMEQIDRIIISRSDVVMGNMNRPVISVFTKSGYSAKKDYYNLQEPVTGYYEAREFYSPVYTQPKQEGDIPDLRTTIYWNPKVKTDDSGTAVLHFYNADKPVKVHARVEGIGDNGAPAVGSASYTIK